MRGEFYAGAMYGVIDSVQSGNLSSDRHNEHWCSTSESVASVLIETKHEPLVQMLLARGDDYRIFAEVLHGFFKDGQLDKVVQILKDNPKKSPKFDFGALIEALIATQASDELIIDFAEYISRENKDRFSVSDHLFYSKNLVKALWAGGRYDLARKLIEKFIDEDQRPFMNILEKVHSGEKVDQAEITELFNTYCPVIEGHSGNYLASSKRTKVVESFLFSLKEFEASVDLLQVTMEAYQSRFKTGQMEMIIGAYDIDRLILENFLKEACFEKAEQFILVKEYVNCVELEDLYMRIFI